MSPVNVNSEKRPDIIVFNNPHALVEEKGQLFSTIMIIEFKRPEKENYSDRVNPIDQVNSYILDILSGNATDKTGRTIQISKNTRFYCYILLTLTPQIKIVVKGNGFISTPDDQGFFFYNPNYNAYYEIMDYDKILTDSQKRNRVLFEHLGLS
jgi:hypothetical protein